MSEMHLVAGHVHNFGRLNDPDEPGNIRVVQTPRGEEVRWVISTYGGH